MSESTMARSARSWPAGTCRRQVTLTVYRPSGARDDATELERVLQSQRGVMGASIHPPTRTARVEYCPRECRVEDIIVAIRQRGYHAHEQDLHYHG